MYQNHHIPTDSNLLQNVDNRGCAFAAHPETTGWGHPKFVGPTVPVWRGRGESPMRHTLWKTLEVLESNFRFSHFSQIVHGFSTRSPKTLQSSKAEVGTSGRTKVWNLSGPLPINCLKKLTNLHPENLPKHSFHWNLEIPGKFP